MKIKRTILIVLLLPLILLIFLTPAILDLLVIYRPSDPPLEPYLSNETLWIDAWLENPVCQPPCLDGIIPGVTPADEVAEKLSAHPGVLRVERDKENYDTEVILWYTPENKTGQLGKVTVDEDTQIVTKINIYSHRNLATMENFINAFGEPDYVYPYIDTVFPSSYCEADLYYVDKGMRVAISSGHSHPPRRNITPSTLISGIVIFSPYLDIEQTLKSQFYNNPARSDINKIVPWEGYREYQCVP